MKLTLTGNQLYANNTFFCYASASPSTPKLQDGLYPVEVRYSSLHDRDMVFADGVGFIGSNGDVDLILGRAFGRENVIPHSGCETRFIGMIERAIDYGEKITLRIDSNGEF